MRVMERGAAYPTPRGDRPSALSHPSGRAPAADRLDRSVAFVADSLPVDLVLPLGFLPLGRIRCPFHRIPEEDLPLCEAGGGPLTRLGDGFLLASVEGSPRIPGRFIRSAQPLHRKLESGFGRPAAPFVPLLFLHMGIVIQGVKSRPGELRRDLSD